MSEYQNPAMPQDELDAQNRSEQASYDLKEAMASGRIMTHPEEGLRTFICPTDPNTSFLVAYERLPSGEAAMTAPLVAGGQVIRWPERINEKFADFHNGVCVTRDPDIIDWLEAHSGDMARFLDYHAQRGSNPREDSVPIGLCRDINDGSNVEAWAELKTQQMATASRPPSLSPNLDVDKLVPAMKGGGAGVMDADGQTNSNATVTAARNAEAVEHAREARFQ